MREGRERGSKHRWVVSRMIPDRCRRSTGLPRRGQLSPHGRALLSCGRDSSSSRRPCDVDRRQFDARRGSPPRTCHRRQTGVASSSRETR
ncbi:hypothetical protein BD309DRAFT_956572 [Dichomitus squalens]|nr:hypothetical protein BD309DRAFT_956572 [Dichomitus squalens]